MVVLLSTEQAANSILEFHANRISYSCPEGQGLFYWRAGNQCPTYTTVYGFLSIKRTSVPLCLVPHTLLAGRYSHFPQVEVVYPRAFLWYGNCC